MKNILTVISALLGLIFFSVPSHADTAFVYDESGQLIRAIDSTGNSLLYAYDEAGNLISIAQSTVLGLALYDFNPKKGVPGILVTLQGQDFDSDPAANTVSFNGTEANVTEASNNLLLVEVPEGTTTGLIEVTVGGESVESDTEFVVLRPPRIDSITPNVSLPGKTLTNVVVTGENLAGVNFSFLPFGNLLALSNISIQPDGLSATFNLTIDPLAAGSFTLTADSPAGSATTFSTAGNTIRILDAAADEDGDGLSNAEEELLGTDIFNPDTDGDGWRDGIEVLAQTDATDEADFPVPLSYGTVSSETIDIGELEAYGIEAEAGDVITLRLGDGSVSSVSIDNQLRVFDGFSGTPLVSVVNEVLAEATFVAPNTGKYLILVADAGNDQTADFDLYVQRLNNPSNVTPIAYGEAITGIAIDNRVEADTYSFVAAAGDIIQVRMGDGSVSGASIDNFVELVDPNGTILAANSGEIEAVLNFTIGAAGTYHLLAKDAGGDQAGAYTISLQSLNNPGDVTPIAYGQVVTGVAIDSLVDTDTYAFVAAAGDIIQVRMGDGSVSGASIDNFVELVDPNGTILAANSGEIEAVLNFTIGAAGTYHLLAKDAGGDQAGAYTISLQSLNNPGDVTPIAYGEVVTGIAIDSLVDTDTYAFVAAAGDIIQVRMGDGSVSGASIDNFVELVDPNGTILAANSGEIEAVLNFTIGAAGTYHLLAKDAGGDQAGAYTISLQSLNNPGDVTPIAYGEVVTGVAIDSLVDTDTYAFVAAAGDIIQVRMGDGSVSGASIDNFVELVDPNGTILAADSGELLAVLNFTIGAAGTYHLLAKDAGGDQVGSYAISLESLNNPGDVTPIAYGEVVTGVAIDSLVDTDAYSFQGTVGDIIQVRMGDGSVSGASIDNFIELIDPSGVVVTSAGAEIEATLAATLAATGTYYLLASDAGGEQTQPYGLALQSTTSPGNTTPLAFGVTVNGNISGLVDFDSYQFTGVQGQDITITMSDGSNSGIDNRIELYAPDGSLVTSAGGEFSAVLSETLAADGEFLIIVSDANGEQSAGYSLSLDSP